MSHISPEVYRRTHRQKSKQENSDAGSHTVKSSRGGTNFAFL